MIVEPLRRFAVPIDSVNLDATSAKLHPARNVAAIAASLATFGQRKPIVVQLRGRVVRAGNAVVLAARDLGWTEIAAVVVDDSDLEAIAFALADDRTAELSRWNEPALADLLATLQDAPDFDHLVTGFTDAEIAQLRGLLPGECDPDDVPEAPAVPVTRPGDLWVLGEHRVLCGDATDAAAVERLLAGERPGLMVTDPPYGVRYDPSWRVEAGVGSAGVARGRVANDHCADWREAYALFPGAVAYVWHAGLFAGVVAEGLEACRFRLRAQIVWVKSRAALSRGHYHWQHEPALFGVRAGEDDGWRFVDEHQAAAYAVRRGDAAAWAGGRRQSTVWDIPHVRNETGHGTQKPVECMARPMRNHGDAGDLVYDPFLGSGTSIVAAEATRRRCVGLELDPAYCDVIVARWEAFTGRRAERRPA